MSYVVKLIRPDKKNTITLFSCVIDKSENVKIIYDAVSFFEKNIFPNIKNDEYKTEHANKILLRDIINIHDASGIKDIKQIKGMRDDINQGKDVFSSSGIPNIQLVYTKDNKLLLFNGHHTMLSYMMEGKEYLDEINHIIVEDKNNKFMDDDKILVFFGKHGDKISNDNNNWVNYVINWQAPQDKQLCERKQNSMGELLDTLQSKT